MPKSGKQIHLGVEARDLLEAAAVPCSEILPVVFFPRSLDGWLRTRLHLRPGDRPPSSEPYSGSACSPLLSWPTCPVFTGFHAHLHISKFSVHNCSPCVLPTAPLDKNACFPVLCTLDILNTAVCSTSEVVLFPFFF